MRALSLLALLLPVAATALTPTLASPVFDPATFFAGRTEGRGVLKVMMSAHTPVIVHGRGRVGADGVLALDQTVIEGDKAPTERHWTFRSLGGGRYSGTLSDAAGPVVGEVNASRLHLHFRMHGGIIADQLLDLAPDGRSARNHMTFHKFGVRVAMLNETIRRVP